MAEMGGIGAFAQGFNQSFQGGMKNRRLREQLRLEEAQKAEQAQRQDRQFNERMDFQREQAVDLETHRARAQELQMKQFELQKRQADLNVAGALGKVFDKSIPKSARGLLLKQTAKAAGIDTKSDDYKDVEKAMMGLDDEGMKAMQTTIASLLPDAKPGEVVAYAQSVFSGNVTLPQLTEAAGALSSRKGAQKTIEILTGGGNDASMGGEETPSAAEGPAGGAPTGPKMTSASARKAAVAAFASDNRELGNSMLQMARDLEEGIELKQVVGPDGKEKWVREEAAEGMEAPSGRPVKTPEEERLGEEAKMITRQDEKLIETVDKEADVAAQMAVPLETFKSALRSNRFTPGTFGGTREVISRALEFVGIDPEEAGLKSLGLGDPAAAEVMASSANQLGLVMADKMSRLTNMSLDFVKNATVNLVKSKDGNEILVEIMEKTNERALDLQQLKERYITEGTLRPKDKPSFASEYQRLRREPLIDDELKARIEKAARKGAGIDFKTIAEGVEGGGKNILKFGGQAFEVVGKHAKGFPIISVEKKGMGHQNLPVVESPESVKQLKAGELFFYAPTKKVMRAKGTK